ncbi:MAG: hypothetical protein DMF65_06585 [Acidobacteria bacterium]|nr:MAG: hypothetical protein DMF65_06585 [Acidobacteriota bacterium]
MFSKRPTRVKGQEVSKGRSTRPAAPYVETPTRLHPTVIIQRASLNPASLTPRDVLRLQRTFGNRAVGQFLNGQAPRRFPLQAKLALNEPGDMHEQEADRVARQLANVISAPDPQAATPTAQRHEGDAALTTKTDARRAGVVADGEAASGLESAVRGATGSGRPLDARIRARAGRALGADFGGVSVHTDARADSLNWSLRARAFTTGRDIFFRQGEYAPETRGGRELIAHELTHVVQQSGIASRRPAENGKTPTATTASAGGVFIQRTLWGPTDQDYTTLPFSGKRERPTSVVAKVHSQKVGQRGRTPTAMSLLHDPKKFTGASDKLLGFDGGHILGLSLGGEDESYNVVPMYPAFNRGTWKNVESKIEHDALWSYSGMNFGVNIDIAYANATDEIPKSLSATGYADKTDKKTKKTVRKQVADYGTKTQPTDIETTAPFKTSEKDIVTGNQSKKTLGGIIGAAADHIKTQNNDKTSADYLRKNSHLPASTKTDYPDDPADRPYEYLDILSFAGKMDPETTFGSRRLFTARQRELIIQANMARNGGQLKSDDPNDPIKKAPHSKTTLSEKGAADFPEIDHIIPKSLGGSNMFSNARVVSWLLNNKEDRVKGITHLVDVSRTSLPTMPTGSIEEKVDTVIPALLMRVTKALDVDEIIAEINQNYSVNLTQNWKTAIQELLDDMETKNEVTKDKSGKYKLA